MMTSKERAQLAFTRREPDRVPIDYSSNPGIDGRLKAHFGLAADDGEGLLEALEVDFRHVGARYVGPSLHEVPEDRHVDLWGARSRWVEHSTGGYWDFCDFPLRGADADQARRFPLPSPDDFDYSRIGEQCRRHPERFLLAGGAGTPDIINSTGRVRSMEEVLVDLITGEPVSFIYIDRKIEIELEILERTLAAGEGRIDMLCLGEDLGTQIGPMISLDLFREVFRPRIGKFVDLAKRFGVLTMIHCCGSSSWAFDDFIDMGIDVVDTLQPEAKDMAPKYLKDRYGERLSFHGAISTAGPVAEGTVDEVVENVKETLEIMMPGGGYALAPTHQLQDNSPTENVIAMYETALEAGRY
jgi:uroporphyrinogen decarboxylase